MLGDKGRFSEKNKNRQGNNHPDAMLVKEVFCVEKKWQGNTHPDALLVEKTFA